MDLTSLGKAVQKYFELGVAESTNRTYHSAQKKYLTFCSNYNFTPLPVTQELACKFAVFLASQGLRPQSISAYLSAVRHLQISNGLQNYSRPDWPILQYTLRGIKRSAVAIPTQVRLPITVDILKRMQRVLFPSPTTFPYDSLMLWAACCLSFFGFLRSGEATAQTASSIPIHYYDVSTDSHTDPSMVRVFMRQSKTDPYGKGAFIYLGRTRQDICPVVALLNYLARCPTSSNSALFINHDGTPFTRDQFVRRVKTTISAAGIDSTHYAGHSFRIGAATTAAQAGLSHNMIKTLGRWNSEAYQTYIHTKPATLASASLSLINNN